MQAADNRQISGVPLPKEVQEIEDLLLRVFRMTNRVKDQEEKHKALTTKNEEFRTLYKNETYVGEIENDAELKDLMKEEVNFSNQRIEIVTLQDTQRAAEQLLAAQQSLQLFYERQIMESEILKMKQNDEKQSA